LAWIEFFLQALALPVIAQLSNPAEVEESPSSIVFISLIFYIFVFALHYILNSMGLIR
jgi:hypothetical protein